MIFDEYPNTIELFILVAGGFGLLRTMAEMERYHQLRVVALTTLFSLAMIMFFVINVFLDPPLNELDEPGDTFTLTVCEQLITSSLRAA